MSTKVTAARRAAFDVLWRVETEAAYASHLLASERYSSFSREDHALLNELALGVLRWQGQLDFLIARYARRANTKLDLQVVLVLRLGLYQLRFLTRIPPHAVINESVNLIRERKLASATTFVNAVLRAAQREAQISVTDLTHEINDPTQRLSIEASHPVWLIERWIARYGEVEAQALALASNMTPRTAFRFNPRRAQIGKTRTWFNEHNLQITPSMLCPHAFTVESGYLSAQAEPLQKGWIYLQAEASQLVAHLAVDKQAKNHVWRALDLCAAPGSKTTLLASLLPANALVIACDLHHHRLVTMRKIAARLGIDHLRLLQLDATRQLPFEREIFDLVLLDAPCSGLGTLQRHPEIKWRVDAQKIVELAALQRQLIAQAAECVRIGGLLTYAVCSTEPEEGEEVIAWLRNEHRQFRDVTRERLLELGLVPDQLLTSQHGARTFTHQHGTESFFVCTLWKRR